MLNNSITPPPIVVVDDIGIDIALGSLVAQFHQLRIVGADKPQVEDLDEKVHEFLRGYAKHVVRRSPKDEIGRFRFWLSQFCNPYTSTSRYIVFPYVWDKKLVVYVSVYDLKGYDKRTGKSLEYVVLNPK